MHLELKPSIATDKINLPRMVLERGRKSLGRAPDCDWRLPDDLRAASNLHCIIERQGDRFQLTDQSSNGTWVDGALIQDGAAAPIADGSRIAIGGLELTAAIIGEANGPIADSNDAYELADEPLTISAILSDIAPGGRMAGGILSAAETAALPDAPIAVDRKRKGAPSSRNIEIGWSGPPEPRDLGKILPDDWDIEPASELGGMLEHGPAPNVSIALAKQQDFPEAAIISAEEPTQILESPDQSVPRPPIPDPDGALTSLIERLERQTATLQTLLMPSTAASDRADLLSRTSMLELDARLAAILAAQQELHACLDHLLSERLAMFDPRVVEARVDTRAGMTWGPFQSMRYWRAYRAQFEAEGRMLSAAELLRGGASAEPLSEGPMTASLAKEGKTSDEE